MPNYILRQQMMVFIRHEGRLEVPKFKSGIAYILTYTCNAVYVYLLIQKRQSINADCVARLEVSMTDWAILKWTQVAFF